MTSKTAALALSAFLCSVSCKTGIPVQGMVYDQDNRPVGNFRVVLDGNIAAVSDFNGRFAFPSTRLGMHEIAGDNPRYIPFRETWENSRRTDIIHLGITSISSLYIKADRLVSEHDFEGAEKILRSMPEGERTSDRYRLYEGIILFRKTGVMPDLERIPTE